MSDSILALILTVVVITALFAWVPLLLCTDTLMRRCFRPSKVEKMEPTLEEASPKLTGDLVEVDSKEILYPMS